MVSIDTLIAFIFNGAMYSFILLLVSLGLSIVFGLAGVVNFAHGSFYMLGAYMGLVVLQQTGSFLAAVAGAFLIVALIGGMFEIVAFRQIYDQEPLYQVLLTFGLVLIIDSSLSMVFGHLTYSVETPVYLQGTVDLGIITYPLYRLFVLMVSALLTLGIWLVLHYSHFGSRLRATTYNDEIVQSMGINTTKLLTVTFVLASGMAGLAGILAAPVFNISLDMGTNIIILAFIIVITGGIGSFKGTVIASFIVGQAEMLGRLFVPDYSLLAVYAIFLIVLLKRERGLFGTRLEDRA